MRFLDNWIKRHCGVFPSTNKREKSNIDERRSILNEFKSGSSINNCVKNHPNLEIYTGRLGNKSVVVFDRCYSPESFATVERDRLTMYYDKYTKEAIGSVYEWEENNG